MKRKKNSNAKASKSTKASEAKSTKKPRKTSDLSQTHGKVEDGEEKFTPTTLDQIWGDTGDGKYGTLEEAEYISELDEMSLTDMHAHAAEVGIIPIDSRDMLEKRLIREFNKHTNAYRKPAEGVAGNPLSREKEMKNIPDHVWKILKEGR